MILKRVVLHDEYCEVCGTVSRDVFDFCDERMCAVCEMATKHLQMCNGGMRSRYRFNDFSRDPRDYAGDASIEVDSYSVDDDGNEVPTIHAETNEPITVSREKIEIVKDREIHRKVKELNGGKIISIP